MAHTHKILPHYTYQDWEQWEGKWELVEGTAIAMSPAPVPQHQRVAGNFFIEFTHALKKSGCKKCRAYLPINYRITDDTVLEPDMLVVCGSPKAKYLDFAPALVVEVLSPATALRDRNTKFDIYQQQGIPYYLIVDCNKLSIEIYALVNGEYQLQPFSKTYPFTLDDGCEITADFGEVWG